MRSRICPVSVLPEKSLRRFLREACTVGEQRHLSRANSESGIEPLIRALRSALKQHANPKRARGAQAYMKSSMPYRGLDAPTLRRVCKEVFAAHLLDTPEAWRAAALRLWREATHREERYAAIELTGARPYRKAPFQTLAALSMYEEMIVDGAWWDYVDVLAIRRVGDLLLRAHPREMRKTLLGWAKDDDIWRRRSAIISQVAFKEDTDLELLERCIAPSLGRKEFWLRKAIGWALRQYAWTDPAWTRRYVKAHEAELSGLSKREALKNA
jgi:3-methyladenine DNA glycosylase AlkD